MDKVEEILPDLDNYLRKILAKEKLSNLAEKRRKYYVERLDFIKTNPPSLPPRPDGGLMRFPVIDGFQPSTTVPGPVVTNSRKHAPSESEEENIYADMDDNEPPTPTSAEDHYLVPESSNTLRSNAADVQQSWSDSDSGTSYESYGEDDPEESTYMNVDNDVNSADVVPLPKVAKKKKKVHREELPINTLPNVTFKGELHQKGSWSWTKRYCVISDNRLIVYRSEKDPRPVMKQVLLGYDVEYIEKEGRRNHVIRISHPGCESHFFAADLKEIAELWCCHLSPASDVEAPSSGDSVQAKSDSLKSNASANQHSMTASSTSASNLSGSSEGGSGDGVTTQVSPAKVQKVADDKSSAVTEKKKKNILSDILGTFSKKKGQKVKKTVVLGDLLPDPEAVISGVLDVLHETRTNNEWWPKYCVVKNNELQCYHDNVSDGVEFSYTLTGAEIESAGKETKKELSIRLIFNNKEQIILDTSDIIHQGKWLHVLIKAKQGMLDNPASTDTDLLYENQELVDNQGVLDNLDGQQEDIYDEVDDRNMVNGNRNSTAKTVKIDQDNNPRIISRPVLRTSSGASSSDGQSSPYPPPLPQSDPPKRPLSSIKRRSRESEQEDEYENYREKDKFDLSEEMASAFTKIKSQIDTGGAPKSSSPGRERSKSREKSQAIVKTISELTSKSEEGVVKCHLGPTIAEDKELLKTTLNPILSDLRKEKRQSSLDADTLNAQIEDIRKKILTMKKQKSELRGKLLTSRLSREKQNLETQLHDLDQLIEESEQTVNRLQLLSLEVKASSVSRNNSFQSQTSNSSSRSGSFRDKSDSTSSLSSSPQKANVKSTDRGKVTTNTSPTSIHDKQNKEVPPRSPTKMANAKGNGSRDQTTPYANFVTKSSARSATTTTTTTTVKSAAKTTSPTGKSTSNKWSAGPAASAVSMQQKKTTHVNNNTKTEQGRVRTVHTSTTMTVKSVSIPTTTSAKSAPGVTTTSARSMSSANATTPRSVSSATTRSVSGTATTSQRSVSGTTTSSTRSVSGVKSTSAKSVSNSKPGTGTASSTKEGSPNSRKGVKECLKLWEAMSEESPC